MVAQVVPFKGLPKVLGRLNSDDGHPVLTRINDEVYEVYRHGSIASITSDELMDLEMAMEAAHKLIAFLDGEKPRRSLDDLLEKYGLTRDDLDGEEVDD